MAEQNENLSNRSFELCRRVVTTESFIAEAKELYGDRYDYSKVEYKNRDHRVTIVCPVHGDFQVYAREHLDGKGCPKCEKGEKFLAKLKEKFGDKFGLDEFVYESSTSPVTLICPTHGAFSRLPHQILNLQFGCPMCGNDAKDEIHNAAVARKEAAKEEKRRAREEFEAKRLNDWLLERENRRIEREKVLKSFHTDRKASLFFSPYELYQKGVDEHLEGIRYGGWKTDYYNRYKMSQEEAQKLKYYRVGDTFFRFPNEAPDSLIKASFEKDCYFGNGSFEDYLSHRGCVIHFENDDLVIVEERLVFLERLTENNLRERIEYARKYYQIDWDIAKIYVFPYNTMLFFISDSFERRLAGGRVDLSNPDNWFTIPFSSDFDYHELRRICREFANQHPQDPNCLDNCQCIDNNIIEINTLHHINPNKRLSNLPKSFVGIDFETLYPQRVSACSVGMVKYIDGEIVDRFYTLIRPPFDYPGKCGSVLTWIHGLTEDMVKDARTFEEILPEMESFVDGLPLVAHNACVERACIRDASAFYGVETKLDYENIFDTLTLSRQAEAKLGISEEGPGTHQLDTVCKRFGISGNNHHNALADAEMSGNLMVLFRKILSEGETIEVAETPSTPRQKYNPEDKVQRSDLDCVADNPFKNQVVVLTGFAKADSQEYAHKLNELGAIIKDGVNKKTNILITGYNAGPSKMQKAQELGARIMSEEEFKEIIKQL